MTNLTMENVIKLYLTEICTIKNFNLNEEESEDLIRHILNELSPEECIFFDNLTTKLNENPRRDDYNLESMMFNGCDFTVGFIAKIEDYIARKSRERNGNDPGNMFAHGGSFL
ncbi:hypothetical protein C2G38_2041329 [Gigaspora rosea]|uniref:Uncharacterized protein n=1 Tax=Gigaspora rosea TaxID=44941 RepID=A0A397UTQ5_9GLOM|nr:hypothetical protein C2G38_2041329 [Gigaspora rosea]CAG8597272.1 5072_t:CDS:1 [Gigaspora rosea]